MNLIKSIQKFNTIDLIFITQLVLFAFIIIGILPREIALYLGIGLAIYFLAIPVEDSLVFFVRSIPLFLAMPITNNFDNFNTWRILAGIIFLKWMWLQILNPKSEILNKFKIRNLKFKKPAILLLVLFIFAFISTIPAPNKIEAIKRIIFFLNFAILGIVIYHKAIDQKFVKRLVRNSVIPVIIVVIVGYVQVISTYFIDIYQFMRIWGEGIQCRQFGEQWCNIAVQLGNTWFAYYGEQLSLRVFSLFPDSHSFPQFVLLGIPAILAVATNVKNRALNKWGTMAMLSLLFLIIILSGTRGIWAASMGVLLLVIVISYHLKREQLLKFAIANFRSFKTVTAQLIIFFVVFMIAFPIFSSPQFLVGKSDSEILKARIKSIIDLGETSNSQRIEIWKRTLESIKEKPLLGVGIGNYPVVLKQDIRLAKAGSSAHNLYLHFAAEIGILGGILVIWFLWLVFKKNFKNFTKSQDVFLTTYFAANLIYIPWILIYSLTDVALLDERSFLFFVVTISLILGTKNPD